MVYGHRLGLGTIAIYVKGESESYHLRRAIRSTWWKLHLWRPNSEQNGDFDDAPPTLDPYSRPSKDRRCALQIFTSTVNANV